MSDSKSVRDQVRIEISRTAKIVEKIVKDERPYPSK